MANSIKDILQDCIQQALGLPRDPIQTDIRDMALGILNEQAQVIWGSWPWDNEKLDEFTTPTPDSDGIITFASTVETVRAVRSIATGDTSGTRVWNQDELIASSKGVEVDTDRFVHLSDDSDGNRRIKVDDDNTTTDTYKALCLKRWVDAVVDDAYDSASPSDTPTDYRVLTFILDRAEPALRAFVKDSLRLTQGMKVIGNGPVLLNNGINRETNDSDRERRLNPKSPMFSEVGNWSDNDIA